MDWDLIVVVAIMAAAVLLALALKVVIFLIAKKGVGFFSKWRKTENGE